MTKLLTLQPIGDNTKVTPATIGELLTVKFDNPQNVYDAYVEIDEATIVRWGHY